MTEPASQHERHHMQRDWQLTGVIFFGVLALLLIAAALKILWPFLSAIVIGAVLVVLTWPLFLRVHEKVRGRRGVAATLMILFLTLIVVLPALVLTMLLVSQANALIDSLQKPETQRMFASIDFSGELAFLQRWFPGFDPRTLSPQRILMPLLQQAPGWVARNGTALVGSLAGVVLAFVLVLLSAWYFYMDGAGIVRQLGQLSPLPRRYDKQVGRRVQAVIDATFRGQVMTALAQALATTIGLLITGVPGALLWGSVAAVMSLVPMVGSAVVWIPATVYLAISASMGYRGWWAAVFLGLWGAIVVSTIDNVVRPWAMKGRAQLPAVPLLFSVLGGLQAFGFVGLVIGPLVFSLIKSVIDIYRESFQDAPSGDIGSATAERRVASSST